MEELLNKLIEKGWKPFGMGKIKMNEIRTTKDGKEINLKDMTEEHIINCIKKIKRDGLIVKEVCCGGYDGEDGDVEIYRDEEEERERLIKFYKELLRRKGLNF